MDNVQHTVSFQGQSITVSLSGSLLQEWNIPEGGAALDAVIKVGQAIIANHDLSRSPLEHMYSFDTGNAQPSLDHMLNWIRGERL